MGSSSLVPVCVIVLVMAAYILLRDRDLTSTYALVKPRLKRLRLPDRRPAPETASKSHPIFAQQPAIAPQLTFVPQSAPEPELRLVPEPTPAPELPLAPTHLPYRSDPPSFLNSKHYQAACVQQDDAVNSCAVANASAAGAQPLCTPAALSNWDGSGSWYRTEDGHFSFEPAHCKLRRLAASQARQCLRGKRVAMVGDSLTRYQYLHFVHFLAKEVWPERWADNAEFGRSLCIEVEYNWNWEEFFRETAALLSDASNARSFESCNCSRETWTEARRFNLSSFPMPDGSDGHLSVSFDFIGAAFRGKSVPQLQATIREFQIGEVDGGAILFNVGLWRNSTLFGEPDRSPFYLGPVFKEVSEFLLDQPKPTPLLFWKTTTSRHGDRISPNDAPTEAEARQALVPPWRLYDVGAITERAKAQNLNLHWDNVHYVPLVYEQLNDLLLNQLCDTDLRLAGV